MAPDPRYEEEVSGCTASVAIVSAKKIYVVCWRLCQNELFADNSREMLETPEVFLV